MSTNADNLLELLNGLLDGALTDDERRRIDLAMKEDPSLEERLNELIAMRRSLLRGRSVGRLGPNFARSVVLAARERADMMGDKAPGWLQTPKSRPAIPSSRNGQPKLDPRPRPIAATANATVTADRAIVRRAVRVWIPGLVLAAAASLVLYLGSTFWSPEPIAQSLVSDFQLGAKLEVDADETNAAATDLLAPVPEVVVAAAPSNLPSATQTQPIVDAEIDRDSTSDTSLASSAAQPNMAVTSNTVPEPTQIATDDSRENDLPESIQRKLFGTGVTEPVYTLVVDVTVDPVAQQTDALRALLEQYEIVYSDDLNLDQNQLDTLVDSRMIGPISREEEVEATSDVSVLFVRARATRIDALLVALESRFNDFPAYRYDMSFHPSVLALAAQLSKVVTNDDDARRLIYRDERKLGMVSAFPMGDRSQKYMDIETRKRAAKAGQAQNSVLNDSVSYLILLVRNLPE